MKSYYKLLKDNKRIETGLGFVLPAIWRGGWEVGSPFH